MTRRVVLTLVGILVLVMGAVGLYKHVTRTASVTVSVSVTVCMAAECSSLNVPGVPVTLYDASNPVLATRVTDASGHVTFHVKYEGPFAVAGDSPIMKDGGFRETPSQDVSYGNEVDVAVAVPIAPGVVPGS